MVKLSSVLLPLFLFLSLTHSTKIISHTFSLYLQPMNKNRNRTALVFVFTLLAAFLEVYFGKTLRSNALTTEGWHMMLHSFIVGIGLSAYFFKKHNAERILNISAFNISLILFLFTTNALIRSYQGLFSEIPPITNYALALKISLLGLSIHLINFFVLKHHDHHHTPDKKCRDHNIGAIYLHVLADLFTAILTVISLGLGHYFNYSKADSIAGLISSCVVLVWAFKLIHRTQKKLRT